MEVTRSERGAKKRCSKNGDRYQALTETSAKPRAAWLLVFDEHGDRLPGPDWLVGPHRLEGWPARYLHLEQHEVTTD
jgi:hypothetical protein